MPKYIDYTGHKIGRVKVLEAVEKSPASRWRCLCDCGDEFICLARSFKRGETFECHSCRFERARGIDLTGRHFGRWTVIERRLDENNKTVWFVECDCGNTGLVATSSLGKRGKSMSCGCLGRKEKSIRANTTLYPPQHLKSETKIYAIRARILQNCYNPQNVSYKNYGSKGITMCDLWRNGAKDFYNWCIQNGWKDNYVVHLKTNETVFSPETCFILSPQESTRFSLSKKLTIKGQTHTVYEWADIVGLSHHTLLDRLTRGHTQEEAVFLKSHANSGKKKWPDQEIRQLYESGLSFADVGRRLGFSYVAISKRIKFMGIEIDKTLDRRKYSPVSCVICKTEFVPISSNHKKCQKCK